MSSTAPRLLAATLPHNDARGHMERQVDDERKEHLDFSSGDLCFTLSSFSLLAPLNANKKIFKKTQGGPQVADDFSFVYPKSAW